MILISQNGCIAVEMKTLLVDFWRDNWCIFHEIETHSRRIVMGEYPTKEAATAQIEAIGKALEAGRQVYKFD